MALLSRFRALGSGDRVRLLVAALLLLATRAGVVVAPVARLRRTLLRSAALGAHAVSGSLPPERISWAVAVADRYLPGERSCLMRSLSTEALLWLYGYRPDHRIGVVKDNDGVVEAHSWIEYKGDVLIGEMERLPQYEPLPSLSNEFGL